MSKLVTKALVAAISMAAPLSATVHAQMLEEVVVTAQKRAESLEAVPISVVALTAESLAAAGVVDVKSLQQTVPGLVVGNDGVYSNPSVRGVGSTLAGPGQSANVATYVDGFYRPNQATSNMEFMDVESVQVLKGPQGTLFGRNATGGAILLTTKSPSFSPEASVRASYGSFNEIAVAGYGSIPLTDSLAASLSGFDHSGDGFVENVVTGHNDAEFENYGIRGKLLWNATETINLLLAVDYENLDDPWPNATGVYKKQANAYLFNALPPVLGMFGVPAVYAPDGARKVSNDGDTISKNETTGISLKADFEFDWATLTSYTQWRHELTDLGLDLDGTNAPVFAAKWSPDDEFFTQEFNLAQSDQGPLDWVLGAYYFHDKNIYPAFRIKSFPLTSYVPAYGTSVETDAYALYGDFTYNFASQWYGTLGLRFSRETQTATYETDTWFEQGLGGVMLTLPKTENDKTWNSFTPRFVLRYEMSDATNVYGSFSKGFKSGAFNTNGFQNEPVDPEKIDAWEIGLKTTADSWRLESALFYYDYSDLQTAEWTSTTSVVKNAAKAKIYGADVHVTAALTESLTADVALAYTHARYDEFLKAGVYSWQPALGGVTIVPSDVSDNEMQRTPEFAGSIGLTYRAVAGPGELVSNINYSYQSRIYFDAGNVFSQDPYGLVNARIGWNHSSNGFGIAVYGNNLTDETYINQILPQSLYIGQGMGKPRSFGIELSQKF